MIVGVGIRIKRLLRKRGITIKGLAEQAEIPLNTLYSITKRDSERVDPVILCRIAEVLDVTEDELRGIEIDYGKKLRLAREWAGLTQKELSAKSKIPVAVIQQYETGKRRPKRDTWLSLANALNLAPDELDSAETLPKGLFHEITEEDARVEIENEAKAAISESLPFLNEDGLFEAIKRVEELTWIPRYQRKDTDNLLEIERVQQGGTDTTPEEKPPEDP